jgi:hypothetical protein
MWTTSINKEADFLIQQYVRDGEIFSSLAFKNEFRIRMGPSIPITQVDVSVYLRKWFGKSAAACNYTSSSNGVYVTYKPDENWSSDKDDFTFDD